MTLQAYDRRLSRGGYLPYHYMDRRPIPSQDTTHPYPGRTPIMTEREPDSETNPPRKRIAVAWKCMRCRKRKIRCSGDPGNGAPCNNCKNAGAEMCRFLRVSSEETRLRNESNEFTYDLGSARPYSTRGSVPPLGAAGAQYSPEGVSAVAPNDILSYRSGGSYNYAAKGYYGPVTWSPHGYEDGVDYGLQTLSTPTKYENGTNPALYLNLEPPYAYPSTSTTNLVRPAPPISSGELPNISLSNVAASLPSQQIHSPGKERVLPSPARALPSSGPYREGAYQTKVSSSTHGSPSISSITEVPYLPYEGYASSATLPSQSSSRTESYSSSSTRTSEICTSSRAQDSYVASDSIFSPAETSLRSQGSATELSYRYTDSHRDPGSGAGQLANGQVYTSLPPLTAGYLLGEVEERRVAGVSGVNAV